MGPALLSRSFGCMNGALTYAAVAMHQAELRAAAERSRRVPRQSLATDDCRHCPAPGAGDAPVSPELALRAMDNGAVRRVSSPTFVGRAEQLARFDQALARGAEGEPAALLVAGDSGVGKSRLVAEFAERARAAGARVLTGDCVELGEGELPYAPIVGAAARPAPRARHRRTSVELAAPGQRRARPAAARGRRRGRPPRPTTEFAQARLFEALLALLGRLGGAGAARARHRGPALGRPLDARLPLLPAARRAARAARAGRDLPLDELHRRHPLRPFLAETERLERVERVELQPFSRLELVAQLTGILDSHPDARRRRRPVRALRRQPVLRRGAAGRDRATEIGRCCRRRCATR